ncbi:MAG: alpha/beta hydrolase [Litorimonas sp.]
MTHYLRWLAVLTLGLLAALWIPAAQAQVVEVEPAEDTVAEPVFTLNDPDSEIVSVVCPFKDTVDYEPGRVKCGFITVPENREVPDSRMVRLAFAQIVAEGRIEDDDEDAKDDDEEPIEVRDDPVVYLTGGPGVGISSYVERFLDHELTETRDLYVLNQRGIGASGELCPYYNTTRRELVTAVTTVETERESAQRKLDCFRDAAARGIDLRGYNTVENARDVRALRRALGFEAWNVWGISYGSHLGQMLADVDPDGIRALVLDAIVPNDLGELMRLHQWIDRDFRLIFDECERQDASVCEGLEAQLYAAFDALQETPLTIDTLDEELFPSGTVTLPAAIIAFAPFQMMYEQSEHPAIPAVMQALIRLTEERDPDVLAALGSEAAGGLSDFSAAMGAAIRCNDGYDAAQAEIAAEDLASFPQFAGGVFTIEGSRAEAQACVDAGLAPRDRSDYQLIQSDIPTLIVNGDWDPITPPPLAERIAPGFTNGRLIVVPYAGHGPTRSMSECGSQVMTDFFDDPTQDLSQLDASCLEDGEEPPEFMTYLQTDATLKLAGIAAEDETKAIGPLAMFVIPALLLFGGLIAILCGWVSRRLTYQPSGVPGPGPAGPRALAFGASAAAMIGLALVGVGVARAIEISEVSLLAGFAPPARIGAAFAILGGVFGLLTLVMTIKPSVRAPVRLRTRVGLPIVGLASICLAAAFIMWGIVPW